MNAPAPPFAPWEIKAARLLIQLLEDRKAQVDERLRTLARAPLPASPTYGAAARPRAMRRRGWWLMGVLPSLIGVAIAVFAVFGGFGVVWGITANGGDPNGMATSAPGPTGAITPPAVRTPPIGTCLNDAGTAVPCDGPHAAEVFAGSGDCSANALLAYLGGAPGQDVLRTDLVFRPRVVDGAEVCVVTVPEGAPITRSSDVLLDRSGDAWRRCVDDRVAREVGCHVPHTTEVIYEQADGGEPIACQARADAYLSGPFERWALDLQLREAGGQCLITTRGGDLLTASLRRLGSSPLPAEAGS